MVPSVVEKEREGPPAPSAGLLRKSASQRWTLSGKKPREGSRGRLKRAPVERDRTRAQEIPGVNANPQGRPQDSPVSHDLLVLGECSRQRQAGILEGAQAEEKGDQDDQRDAGAVAAQEGPDGRGDDRHRQPDR